MYEPNTQPAIYVTTDVNQNESFINQELKSSREASSNHMRSIAINLNTTGMRQKVNAGETYQKVIHQPGIESINEKY